MSDGFAQWYSAALDECSRNNGGLPGWLTDRGAAREVYNEMRAAEATSYAKSAQAQELARLRREIATLKATLTKMAQKTVKDVEAHNSNWKHQVNAERELFERVEKLEQKPLEALDLDFDYDGQRTFTVKCQGVTKSFSMPIVLDRGVFTEGTFYTKGDAVSFRGSVWIAQEETMVKPGGNSAWRLSAKAGRNGKDAGR